MHNDHVYERRQLHSFVMSDVEDPELFAAQPIYEWQQTEKGQWVMKNTLDPTFHIVPDAVTFGYKVTITAHVLPKKWTEFCLRFS